MLFKLDAKGRGRRKTAFSGDAFDRVIRAGEKFPRSPAQSYAHDRRAAETCDLLVAFLHPPSIGVGMVIEMALRQYPVLVLVAAPGEPMVIFATSVHVRRAS